MKLVVLDGYSYNPGDLSWDGFREFGELTIYDRTPEDKMVERMKDADLVFTSKAKITKEVLDACPKVKYIGEMATGYNNVDVAAAREKGIPVTNIPSYSTEATAQFAIALLLEICHHVGHHSDAVHAGRWSDGVEWCFWDYPLIELLDKTMGIIGFGRIGQSVAKIAAALGMKVIAHSPTEREEGKKLAEYVSLDELLSRSDVISLHCPLTPQTTGLINKSAIEKMKDGVIIINNSRGPVIDEQALADALNSGKVYAAGLDVASNEPIARDNPLLSAKNCIITPHISWAPFESRKRLMEVAKSNVAAFLKGEPVNVVNP